MLVCLAIFVGIIIGPHSIGLIADTKDTRYLAEFGVVFLMFSIGLKFSPPKLIDHAAHGVWPGVGARRRHFG